MKKFNLFFLIFTICFVNTVNIFGLTDNNIFKDPVYNTYEGTTEAKALINNLKFSDVYNGYWAKEAITKAGALDMVKGYEKTYKPNNYVSNQEALAFAIRVSGLEKQAQEEGQRLKAQAQSQNPLNIWSIGYLSLARNNGLITNQQYNEAISQNQSSLPEGAFKRDANATREQVVSWIIKSLNSIRVEPLVSNSQQSIYNFSDWQNTSVDFVEDIEIALDNGILKGNNGKLNPKGALTRAEMAQILSNMDSLYNEAVGLTKKTGTIAGIKDEQTTQTGQAKLERNIYIRSADGKVDVIKYIMQSSSSPQALDKDTVVYNNGAVTGLASVREGSQIEYLVDDLNKTIKFLSVKDKTINTTEANGKINKVDFANGMIQIKDNANKTYNYYVADGIIGTDNNGNYLVMEGKRRKEKDLPIGSMVKLELKNNIVTKITYVGDATLSNELRGVVIENNAQYGYLTIIDNNGKKVTKNYFADQIEVEKQPYYENGDSIGYLDQMFPHFEYDPRDTSIDQIEDGDIVFITSRKDDPTYIEKLSASPNYIMKRGKVTQINNNVDIVKILVQFDNGQTAWYDIPSGVYTSKGGKPINLSSVVAGDYVKLLVNEAILSPGETMDSVKEVLVEDSGHLIGDILKGQIGAIDSIQKTLSLQNSYKLGKSGWEGYQQVRKLSISNKNIMYYYNGNRVSKDFVNSKLKRANGEVYVALENGYSGNTISKITFRTGRDEPLNPDVVTFVDGVGGFTLASGKTIKTDAGTIVRKNGNLVEATNISVNDYARVSLNGDGKAGIVDIYDAPVANSVTIARGRVKQIEDNKWFVVKSMSQLNGDKWEYSPVERKFTIDEQTLYITEEGIKNINQFIGYTTNTSIDKAFTIIFNGDKATHIIDAPYPTKLVSGVAYETGDTIKLKDGKYMKDNKSWDAISVKDASINLKTKPNTIVVKNNKVTSVNSIQKGDKLRVMTQQLPKIESGMTIDAVIIFVEN
ncbi:S-layer homology domain-containing protein [[Clostridium] colinum]|uniref:S-layer homology domain-containing protein n=1 Tax=[Clostridium] colinum TaxID=36835 RepID=UPI002024B755|nr:S-layer homology domain-containing protein [[Clostridium] colinum]